MPNTKSYIAGNGDAHELDEEWFATASRGRPALPENEKKKRVNLMLDPDVVEALTGQNKSALVNRLLREKLGL